VQDSPAYLLSSVVDALTGILAKFSPADQAVVSGLLTSELGAPAVPKKRRLPAPSSTTADPRLQRQRTSQGHGPRYQRVRPRKRRRLGKSRKNATLLGPSLNYHCSPRTNISTESTNLTVHVHDASSPIP
jgi:hypothetical protein